MEAPNPTALESASPEAGEKKPKEPVKTVRKSKRWLRAQLGKEGLTPHRRRAKTSQAVAFGSHGYYNNKWADTMRDVREMLAQEKKRGTTTGTDRKKMCQLIFDVYFKYLKIYKSLDEVYDQMVHPQKRLVVRKLLDLVIGRCLELKSQLVLCDLSEVYYLDDFAAMEGLMPKELDMPIPKYYYHDPTQEMMDRDQWFINVGQRARLAKEQKEDAERKKKQKEKEEAQERGWDVADMDDEKIDFEDSVIPLQAMERARQMKGKYIITKYYQEEESSYTKKKAKHPASKRRMDPDKAAIIIQKMVRGFVARARVKKMRNDEMEFLGIRPTAKNFSTDFSFDYFYRFTNSKCKQNADDLEALKESKRVLRRLMKKNYEDDKITTYEKLKKIEGPDIAERFKYQIRQWYLSVKEEKGKFPTIPKADVGGSRMMICPESLPEDVREKGREATDPEYAAKKKKERQKAKEKAKKEKAKAKAKKAKDKKKKKGGPAIAENPTLEAPKNMDDFKEVNLEYNKFWRGLDDKDNPEQKHEMKYIIRDKRQLVADEVRVQVDIAMREELDYLKKEMEKKKGKKGKGKGKKGGKKGKGKGKKGKGKKGKKGKKKKKRGKDLTPNRTMESLFEELVQNKIIRQYPKVRMDDMVAQCSFINGELRQYHETHPFEKKTEERFMPGDANPPPYYGDILKAIKDSCILPMGSVEVHEVASPLTKSVLICGPPGSGKRTLVNMICTELRATLMDLTAVNIAGKYPGKPGLKMMMHLIDKVGHAVAPVVILINNCEKMFQKKVPKDDKTEPKRLKKVLPKYLKKSITGEDLFLVIGLSSEPWLAGMKSLKKLYNRIIYIPPADYATRFDMWKRMLNEQPELLNSDMSYSLLAKLSHGWTVGNIKRAITDMIRKHHKDVSKQKRDRQEDMNPWGHLGNLVVRQMIIGKLSITMDKLIECIGEYDPVFLEQEKTWTKWWNKTPLQKARNSNIVRGGGDKKKGKKGDKGKGKGKKKGKR